MANTDF